MNIIEYVYQNLNTFSEREFNMVDSLVLSQLSYARMEGHKEKCIRDYNKLEYFPDMFCDDISDKENKELFMEYAMTVEEFWENTEVMKEQYFKDGWKEALLEENTNKTALG